MESGGEEEGGGISAGVQAKGGSGERRERGVISVGVLTKHGR